MQQNWAIFLQVCISYIGYSLLQQDSKINFDLPGKYVIYEREEVISISRLSRKTTRKLISYEQPRKSFFAQHAKVVKLPRVSSSIKSWFLLKISTENMTNVNKLFIWRAEDRELEPLIHIFLHPFKHTNLRNTTFTKYANSRFFSARIIAKKECKRPLKLNKLRKIWHLPHLTKHARKSVKTRQNENFCE